MTSIADLRRSYTLAGLSEIDVLANPVQQFQRWFQEALDANLASEANAMTLATVTPDGKPSARIVLLKGVDEQSDKQGFVFYTNYESQKAQDLAAHPQACLLFHWAELERQVRIEGVVEKVSAEETQAYFQTRPLESRIGAWASHQSTVLPSRAALETRFQELLTEYEGKDVPVPPYWGGYRVLPERMEFWQGRTGRLHDRIAYTHTAQGWRIERLSP